jgi:hypothetical protein
MYVYIWDYSLFHCRKRVCKICYLSDSENYKMNSPNKFDPSLCPPTHTCMHAHTEERFQEWRATSTPEVCGCYVVILKPDSLGQKSTSLRPVSDFELLRNFQYALVFTMNAFCRKSVNMTFPVVGTSCNLQSRVVPLFSSSFSFRLEVMHP